MPLDFRLLWCCSFRSRSEKHCCTSEVVCLTSIPLSPCNRLMTVPGRSAPFADRQAGSATQVPFIFHSLLPTIDHLLNSLPARFWFRVSYRCPICQLPSSCLSAAALFPRADAVPPARRLRLRPTVKTGLGCPIPVVSLSGNKIKAGCQTPRGFRVYCRR